MTSSLCFYLPYQFAELIFEFVAEIAKDPCFFRIIPFGMFLLRLFGFGCCWGSKAFLEEFLVLIRPWSKSFSYSLIKELQKASKEGGL